MKLFIKYIISLLQRFIYFLETRLSNDKSKNIIVNSLAPKILTEAEDIERIQPYLDNLKQAIDTDGINNIAITGSYGSGKSTIIKTFQNLNQDYEYLNISLASFTNNTEDKKEFGRKLEVSILQQMFYHVDSSVIPDSRFRRIVNVTWKKLLSITIFNILWILCGLILIKFEYIEKLNPNSWKLNRPLDWVSVISTSLFLIGIGLFAKSIYRLFSNSSLNKISIKGEIEIGNKTEKSVFNQHLEEILYFFERTRFNIVVIEDVDRFESTDIFTKLREINTLLNYSTIIGRKIKFIYAIKDEMFTHKNDRVKFFEFIIPIISFINPNNANDQLIKLIAKANLQRELSEEFTSDIVTFIDDIDMRLLINIFQEYQIYRIVLSKELKQDNLFAILVYKNIYPDDYSQLGKRQGNLYDFFNKKPEYIKNILNEFKEKITKIENQISILENEIEKPIKELRAVYINMLASKIQNFHSFHVNHKEINLIDALEDDNFNAIKNSQNIQYNKFEIQSYGLSHNVRSSNIIFSDIEKNISKNYTYNERETTLIEKKNNKAESLKKEIGIIQSKIEEMESLSISEIFEVVDSLNYLGKFRESNLMRNLLINGYIDEYYEDYISLFHEISLTKNDFSFERKVKSGIASPANYELNKTVNIIKRLALKYFKREVILNYTLLDELIKLQDKFTDKYNYFFELLNKDSDRTFQFILGYTERKESNLSKFIRQLINTKKNFIAYLLIKSNLPDNKIRELICIVFEHSTSDDIKNQLELNLLVDWFNNIHDFCSYSSKFVAIKKLHFFLNEQNVVFVHLDSPTEQSNETFRFIVDNNLYLITVHNLLTIFKWHNPSAPEIEFYTLNYTFIKNKMPACVLEHIEENISAYVKNVILNLPSNNNESEESIVDLLNNKEISSELKTDFIQMQNLKLTSISSIESLEDKKLVLSSNKIQPTWENIFEYYDCLEENAEFDQIMIDFFNNEYNYKYLSADKLSVVTEKEEEYINAFSLKLIYCKPLIFTAYTNLLNSIPYRFNSLRFTELNKQKVEFMIENKFIILNPSNFEGIKEIDNQLAIRLLEVYEKEFVEKTPEFTLDKNDWLLLLKSEHFNTESKIIIIENINDDIIIENESIADLVCNILSGNKYIPLNYEVLVAIFKANKSGQKRIELLDLHFDKLTEEQLISLIGEIGENYARMFVKQNKPTIANTPYSTRLIEKLKKKDMISSFSINKEKNEIKVVAKYTEE
jgi:ABC-type dipeptide/oligopeptide/nickel transport system ATPase subunit